MGDLLTVTDVASLLGVKAYRVTYAIATYGITPVGRAGIIRLFSRDQLDTIRGALRRTSERGGRNG